MVPFRIEIVEGLLNEPAGGRRQLAKTEAVVALVRPGDVAAPEQRSMLATLLSEDERERLTRFRFESDRQLFLVSHALLRIALSRHAGTEPHAWRFHMGSHGRPEIAEPRSRLRFSLSHTKGLAACAMILDREIGLDVEYLTADPPIDAAERFFSPRERCDMLCTPVEARAEWFLEYWTLKEAYAKARGLGLSLPPDQCSLYKGSDGRWRIALEPPLYEDPERWRFWSWRVNNGHQMALAIDQSGASSSATKCDPPW
jgi:4'-phosphopantetheinyl transferase